MQSQSRINLWRQLLARSTLSVTLVGSLVLYHQTVLTNTVTFVQKRWKANAGANSDRTSTQYRPHQITIRTPDAVDEVYDERRKKKHCSWTKIFKKNKN